VTALPAPGSILVTGAAGFAGSHLLDLLRPGGRPIVGWHHPSGAPPEDASGAPDTSASPDTSDRGALAPLTWQGVDLTDRESVRAALEVCRPVEVYHLAGAADQGRSWNRTDEALRVNALGTEHVLDGLRRIGLTGAGDGAASAAGATRVLVIGSAAVYRPSDTAVGEDSPIGPVSPYGVSKLAQEMIALQAFELHGQPVMVARSFNHIGPRQSPDFVAASFARQVATIEAGLAPPVIDVGNLEPRRDLSDVRDTVRAYQALMQRGRPGRAYNVSSGHARPIRDILDGLLAQSGARVEVRVDPARLRPVDQPLVLGSYDRLAAETGWRPEVPWERTLADLLQDWRARVRVR
jgi:GDP-4-dehydro-6-deoxy-D-mannose reductase